MKRFITICAIGSILFCIDYALTTIFQFSFFIRWFETNKGLHFAFAFFIGICGFVHLLCFSKKEEL